VLSGRLLGGAVRTKLPVARSISLNIPEVMKKEAQDIISEGIYRIKLKAVLRGHSQVTNKSINV